MSQRKSSTNRSPKASFNLPRFRTAELEYLRKSTSKPEESTKEDEHVCDSGVCSEASRSSSSSSCGEVSESSVVGSDRVKKLLELCGLQGNEFFSPPIPEPCSEIETPKKWKIGSYIKTKKDILDGITFNYSCVLIVWDSYDVRCDYFYSFLEKFGETVSVHDRWIPYKSPLKGGRWGGAVVVYPDKKIVKRAVKEIPKKHW